MIRNNKNIVLMAIICLILIFSVFGCENNNQSIDDSYKEGYSAGYEAGFEDGNEKYFAQFSGSFTATVEKLIPDYCVLPGNTIAVVHFFQNQPFLLRF